MCKAIMDICSYVRNSQSIREHLKAKAELLLSPPKNTPRHRREMKLYAAYLQPVFEQNSYVRLKQVKFRRRFEELPLTIPLSTGTPSAQPAHNSVSVSKGAARMLRLPSPFPVRKPLRSMILSPILSSRQQSPARRYIFNKLCDQCTG